MLFINKMVILCYLQDWDPRSALNYAGNLDTNVIFMARLQSRAKSSFLTYKSGFNSWKRFCNVNSLSYFPVNGTELSICILEMVKNGSSWPSISSTINSVNYFQNLFMLQPVVLDKFVLDYCKRFARKVDKKKRPLLKHEFSAIIRSANKSDLSSFDLRNICLIIFGFCGFLRYDDLSQLRLADVDIFGSFVSIIVPEGNADQTYKSQKVELKLDYRCTEIVRRYVKALKFAKFGWHRNDLFFFSSFKRNDAILDKKLAYKDCRSCILNVCKANGIDSRQLGTHSLRIGGCSEASRQGVPDYLLDLHGRWAFGSTARAGYQRLTPDERFLISNKLHSS